MDCNQITMIENYRKIDKNPFPSKGIFLNEDLVQLQFVYPNPLLARSETSVSTIDLSTKNRQVIPTHNDSEKLSVYSNNGTIKAVIRSIPFSKQFPVDTPKIGSDSSNVVFLEVFQDSELIATEILTAETGDIITHPSISSGLRLSPNNRYAAWVSATKKNNARKSIFGYKVQTYDFKDYGEDIDGVYSTNLIIYDITTRKTRIIGTPKNHGACKFCFASENVIILQAVDLSSPRIQGIRSYANRPFHLFALDINNPDQIEFHRLFERNSIYLSPETFIFPTESEQETVKVFCGRFVDDFGGHNGPSHLATFNLNLKDLTAHDYKESQEVYTISNIPLQPFINDHTICLTIEDRCKLVPISVDLDTFQITKLIQDTNDSIIIDDYRNGKYLIRVSSPIETPRFAIFSSDSINYLTKSTTFDQLTSEILYNDNYNDAILILSPGEKKRFIVSPHGGPHGMFSTYFARNYVFLALCGYSVAMINFRGSTGYPIDVQRSLPGKCGEQDVQDVADIINQLKSKYDIEKLGIYGYSHGGFLATHFAGQHPELIEFAVAGGPVTNIISNYYAVDIPDWCLYEAGVTDKCDGEYEIDEEALHKMWKASPIQYAKNAKVPVLLVHGKNDRRVHALQSIDYYLAMKRNGNPVKMIMYDMNGHSMKLLSCFNDFMANVVEFANDPQAYIDKDDSELYVDSKE